MINLDLHFLFLPPPDSDPEQLRTFSVLAQRTKDKPLTQTNIDGMSPLCVAIKKEHTKAAFILLKAGAPVNGPQDHRNNKETPLMRASKQITTDRVDLLLSYGADPNL